MFKIAELFAKILFSNETAQCSPPSFGIYFDRMHFFLFRADRLDHVMYRMGVLAVLRSKLKKGNH